jgi:hypothetical protein
VEITWKNQSRFAPAEDKTFGDVDRQYKLIGQDNDDDAYRRAKPLPIRGQPIPDLSIPRRGPPPPSREREIELIMAAQAGDAAAANDLTRHFSGWLHKLARERWRALASFHRMSFNHPDRQVMQDLLGIALATWWRQVLRWQPGFGGLCAFAKPAIEGALADAKHDFRNQAAIKDESDFGRFVRSHPGFGPEEIQKHFPKMSLDEIARERAYRFDAMLPIAYTEDGADTNDDSGDHDADGDYKGGDESQFDGPVRGYEGGLVISEWSRSQATNSLHPARQYDCATDWVKGQGKSKRQGSIFADRITADAKRRMLDRLDRQSTYQFDPDKDICPPTMLSQQQAARPVRHVEPLPGPGQPHDAKFSLWNVERSARVRSLFAAEPTFDETIADTIGATITADDNNDDTALQRAA